MHSPERAGSADTPPDGGSFVIPLRGLNRAHLALVGGKAANLGEMLDAGLVVPGGFCVTTDAYAAGAAPAELSEILERIAATSASDTPTLERLASAARAALLSAPVPEGVAAAVREAYTRLVAPDTDVGEASAPDSAAATGAGEANAPVASPAVAVRSSATAEDLPGASFAGQQDTYLNVMGAEEVILAVRRCWASLWTDRAVAYRARNGIDPHTVRLAVVVQRQVEAAVAGVMFTANPVTGTRMQAVIDASPGLGEAVVSGAVTPDHFVVDLRSGAILERRLGDKRVRIEGVPEDRGGGTRRIELPADHAGASAPSLSDAQLGDLKDLALRVERHYGDPQDTEWAIDGRGALWLLQARPITTLYPLPRSALSRSAGGAGGEDLRVYFSFNVAQGVYQPLTPMGIQAFQLLASAVARRWNVEVSDPAAGPPALVIAGHRVYLDVSVPLRNPLGRRAFRGAMGQAEARTGELVDELVRDPRLAPTVGSPLSAIVTVGRFALANGLARGVARALRDPVGARQRAFDAMAALPQLGEVGGEASAADRLDRFARLPAAVVPRVLDTFFPLILVGVGSFFLAQRLLGDLATRAELDAVRRGLPHNPTTEMDLELWALSQRLRGDAASASALAARSVDDLAAEYASGALPAVLQRELGAFLEAYGHRGVAEIDLGVPHWADDPRHLLGVLANYLALEDASQAPDVQFRKVAEEADQLVDELARRACARGALRGRLVGFLLSRVRQLGGMREAPKAFLVKMLHVGRSLLAPVGEELARSGRLERAEDIYLLTLLDARSAVAGADVRALVRARRESMALESLRRQVPRLILSDGTVPTASSSGRVLPDARTLVGTGASAGTVTAAARVILDPRGARLVPGEILVAPSTDPGWTPLFLTAGGLVMEMGGPMSHGAIVAREYGIPAVVGTAGATERIRTGQRLTVDGAHGVVTIEDIGITIDAHLAAVPLPDRLPGASSL